MREIRKGKEEEHEGYVYNYRHAPNIFAPAKNFLSKLKFESSVKAS